MPIKAKIQPPVEVTPELEIAMEQTEFAGNEPLFEEVRIPVAPKPTQLEAVQPTKKSLPVLIGLGALGVLLLLGIVLVFIPPQTRVQTQEQASPTPSPTLQMTDQQRRVKELRDDLQEADPTKLDLPFPPVSMDINLGDPKKP